MKRIAAIAAAALGLLAGVLALAPNVGVAADPTALVSQCAVEQRAIQVQMVIDESGSLVNSDKFGRREFEITQWVNELLAMSLAGYDVRLAIAGYGSQWRPLLDWFTLDGASAPAALGVVNVLTKQEEDTDHALALLSASGSLDRAAVEIENQGGTPCPMILWFTDGGYDFGGRSPEYRRDHGLPATTPYSDLPVNNDNEDRIKSAGIQRMCGPGGIVLALRDQQTDIRAIALNPELDFRLVQELANGDGYADDDAGPGCRLPHYEIGTFETVTTGPPPTAVPPPPPPPTSPPTTVPVTASPGTDATTTVAPSTTLPPPSCDADLGCVDESTFDAPRFSDALTVRFDSGESDDIRSVTLRAPDGTNLGAVGLAPGSTRSLAAGGVTGELVALTPNSVLLSVGSTAQRGLVGEWQVEVGTASEEGAAAVSVGASSDLRPRLAPGTEVVAGTDADVMVAVVNAAGEPASVEGLVLDPIVLPSGDSVPWSIVDDTFVLALSSDMTSTDLGTVDVRPQLRADPDEGVVFIDAPLSVPIVRPEYPGVVFPDAVDGSVRPATFDAPGKVEIPFTVVGPLEGRGCAIGAPDPITNADGDSVNVLFPAGAETCVSPGQEVDRTLVVDVDERIESRFCGSVVFELTGEQAAGPRDVRQSICIRTERGPNIWSYLLAGGLVLVGFAPLLILGLLNRRLARLPVGELGVATPLVREETDIDERAKHGMLATHGGAALLDDEYFEDADVRPYSLKLLDDRYEVQSRPNTVPRPGKRGRFSPKMLFSGPRTYLLAHGSDRPVIVGSGAHHIHSGPLVEPLLLPANTAGLWVMELGERGEVRATPLRLAVVRQFGARPNLDDISDGIRAVANEELQTLLATGSEPGGGGVLEGSW